MWNVCLILAKMLTNCLFLVLLYLETLMQMLSTELNFSNLLTLNFVFRQLMFRTSSAKVRRRNFFMIADLDKEHKEV